MLKKIVKFIKYNTLAVTIIAVAFIAVASAMADEDTRDKIIGEEIIEKSGVDNTALLAADLENFDMEMKIVNAMEDPPEVEDGNFYIDYQYKTLAIKDSVWQEVLYAKQMTVSKRSLEGRDLGLYVMEELGEIIDYQLAYLKEVQENEEDKGVTVVLETTEYTGLIGLVLDTKTKELPGYEPVVQPEVAEAVEDDGNITDEEFEEEPRWLHSGDSPVEPDCNSAPQPYGTMEPAAPLPEETEYPDDAAYWEQVKNNCLNGGGFWYNETCNAKEEENEEEPESSGHLEETGTPPEAVTGEDSPPDEDPVEDEKPEEEEPAEEPAPADGPPADEDEPEEEEPMKKEPAEEEPVEPPVSDEPAEEL